VQARTFLIRFLPSDKIFSLLIPASDPILSILFVDKASRLQPYVHKTDSKRGK
jgi:hypothetical protein